MRRGRRVGSRRFLGPGGRDVVAVDDDSNVQPDVLSKPLLKTLQEVEAPVTVKVMVAVCVVLPPVPVTVTVYVPAGVVAPAVSVRTDVPAPGAAIEAGLKTAVVLDGRFDAVSATAWLKLPDTVVVMVTVCVPPCATETVVGEADW